MIWPKSLLFQFDPETIHNLSIDLLSRCPMLASLWGKRNTKELQVKFGETIWRSPIGLAAGLDKNAQAISFFDQLGFGAIEVGTVTPRPQVGNPKPRIFRYPADNSLRNSMGFPNQGLDVLKKNLSNYQPLAPLGVNIGKNKITPNDKCINDYLKLYKAFEQTAQYIVINISSPNTPGLRELQEIPFLKEMINQIHHLYPNTQEKLYIKISPDMTDQEIEQRVGFLASSPIKGVIATNTTMIPQLGIGGASGQYLKEKAHHVRSLCLKVLEGSGKEFIGVGGMSSFEDVLRYWLSGGKVFQVYTSFIFQGPQLLIDLEKQMINFLTKHQFKNIEEFFKLDLTAKEKLIGEDIEKIFL